MFDNAKLAILMGILKRTAVPIVIGATVGWLAHHGYDNWANVVCSLADAMAVYVEECN